MNGLIATIFIMVIALAIFNLAGIDAHHLIGNAATLVATVSAR